MADGPARLRRRARGRRGASGSGPPGDDAWAGTLAGLAADLFAVGLGLASCVGVLQEPARARVVAAIERIDELIVEMRRDGCAVLPGQAT